MAAKCDNVCFSHSGRENSAVRTNSLPFHRHPFDKLSIFELLLFPLEILAAGDTVKVASKNRPS